MAASATATDPVLPFPPGDSGEVESASGEALPQYLREIGRVPLLTAADEVELAQALEAGLQAADRLRSAGGGLAADAREQLERLVAAGEQARRALTEANLRLVVSIARRYANRGVPLGDLIQEGNIGLMHAVEKFDWRRGYKFSTYATWWIRQSITRAIADDSRTIRIPVHLHDLMNRLARAAGQLYQELGREPTLEEISAEVGVPVERARELAQAAPAPMSLDGYIGGDKDTRVGDLVPDPTSGSMDDVVERTWVRDRIQDTLMTLTPRERFVIELRFGLRDDRECSLTEVGRQIGVTRERIRQIEGTAMGKLRHPSRSRHLRHCTS